MTTVPAPAPAAPRPVQGRLDAFARWGLERAGGRYFHALALVTAVLVPLVSVPLQNLPQVPFWTGDFRGWRHVGVLMALALVTAAPVLGLVLLPRHRALVDHLRGRAVDPVDVWRACVTRLPASAAITALVWSAVIVGPGIAWVGWHEHFGVADYAGAYACEGLLTLGVAALYFMLYEVALLPVAREVAPRLPRDFADRSPVSGRRRLMLLSTAITFTVGCQTAGLSSGFVTGKGRIWVVVLVIAALGVTYVGLLLALVSSSVTRRVDELAGALNEVAHGGTNVRILPTSGDEFDAVGAAYNTMVELLEAHADDLSASRARLVAVADRTRQGIERDLHDGAQQNLALVSVLLGQLERACRVDPALSARVGRLRGELSGVVTEMRSLAHGIYPASLEAEGLASALRAAAREASVTVVLDLDLSGRRWPHQVETATYFCCWELIQRARHAGVPSPEVGLELRELDSWGIVTLSTRWTPPAEQVADLERFLQDRLGAVGGAVGMVSNLDTGVAFVGSVPL